VCRFRDGLSARRCGGRNRGVRPLALHRRCALMVVQSKARGAEPPDESDEPQVSSRGASWTPQRPRGRPDAGVESRRARRRRLTRSPGCLLHQGRSKAEDVPRRWQRLLYRTRFSRVSLSGGQLELGSRTANSSGCNPRQQQGPPSTSTLPPFLASLGRALRGERTNQSATWSSDALRGGSGRTLHSSQNQRPSGMLLRPTHGRWNCTQ